MTPILPLKCIILAAGASRRLGKAKALIEKNGIPLIQWMVNRLESKGIEPIIITRQELMLDIAICCPERTIVVNPDPDAGRTGSIQCGILHINSEKSKIRPYRLLMVPIDRPGFSDETLSIIIKQHKCCVPSCVYPHSTTAVWIVPRTRAARYRLCRRPSLSLTVPSF